MGQSAGPETVRVAKEAGPGAARVVALAVGRFDVIASGSP